MPAPFNTGDTVRYLLDSAPRTLTVTACTERTNNRKELRWWVEAVDGNGDTVKGLARNFEAAQ